MEDVLETRISALEGQLRGKKTSLKIEGFFEIGRLDGISAEHAKEIGRMQRTYFEALLCNTHCVVLNVVTLP